MKDFDRSLLDEYLNGDLRADRTSELEAWLEADPRHREAFVREVHAQTVVRNLLQGESQLGQVVPFDSQRAPSTASPARLGVFFVLALAAAALLVVGVGLLWRGPDEPPPQLVQTPGEPAPPGPPPIERVPRVEEPSQTPPPADPTPPAPQEPEEPPALAHVPSEPDDPKKPQTPSEPAPEIETPLSEPPAPPEVHEPEQPPAIAEAPPAEPTPEPEEPAPPPEQTEPAKDVRLALLASTPSQRGKRWRPRPRCGSTGAGQPCT